MKCPKCQTENPEGSSFCRGCGQALKTELVRSHCQHVDIQDSKFCNKCGQPLTPTQVTSPPSVPSSPLPTSFANNRYKVKKKVYLAHDTVLDLDVA